MSAIDEILAAAAATWLAGQIIDIPPGPRGRSYADRHVDVHQLLDGSWRVYLANLVLALAAATEHTELRARRRRKYGRGAPASAPAPALMAPAAG
jgi:hypothetical protein